ncbi:ribonuclease R [Selenomonadales bacterium OttesenSCG-928-I06]|nr:ribonuclease R [Selenomonadales bacterium OttesenSCG-928-I06]
MNFMRKQAYKPLTSEDLALQMDIRGDELEDFWQVIKELESKAHIIKTRYDKYGLPECMNLMVGRLSTSVKGYGFVLSEKADEADVFIPQESLNGALHGDRVVARIHYKNSYDKSFEGKIIRIVERVNKNIVGTFEKSKKFGFVIPDDKRIKKDIFVAKEDFNGANTGDKVVVEIVRWPEKQRSSEGKIVEVLGKEGDLGIEILSIIKKHDLDTDFSPEAIQMADKVNQKVQKEEIGKRRDLRDLEIVTIDGEDAKDLDDAVYVERLKNGCYLLGVHIADVSYYVKENTALDKDAYSRATSVYLVDRVLPMLPKNLSNGICSLNAGEDRLALSVNMEIDNRGQIVNYEIYESVINVKKRLSYSIVRKILLDHDEELRKEYEDFVPHIEEMERLCRILREKRLKRGAIDFDFPELKVKLDDQGNPVEIEKRVRSIAESIIEEFMLAANETVAEHMDSLNIPSVFRIHEEPDEGKMVALNSLLNSVDNKLPLININKEVRPMALQKILNKISGKPEERIISTIMLRSLKQARYEAENLGHFGLAADYYTHFTSPIRRYPDLIVHRMLRETFAKGGISASRKQKLQIALPRIAFHSSQKERAAAEAERESVELKKVEYMQKFIGKDFAGIITGVTAFGLFVEIENGVEGLVHVSSMDDDYYEYVEDRYSLIGMRTRKVYRLGDSISIIVVKADPLERTIDFMIVPAEGVSKDKKARNIRAKKPARETKSTKQTIKNKSSRKSISAGKKDVKRSARTNKRKINK